MISEYKTNTIYSYYNYPNNYIITLSDIPHTVRIVDITYSLRWELINWCDSNCQFGWGWYYDNHEGINFGFFEVSEKTLFCLTHDFWIFFCAW